MQIVNLPVKCPDCHNEIKLQVNLWTGEHKILGTKTHGVDIWRLVEHYKKVKGYDKLPTWDKINKARAMKAAKKVLTFFAPTSDPLGLAQECIDDTEKQAKKEGWNWTLETIVKIADRWLLEKQKGMYPLVTFNPVL